MKFCNISNTNNENITRLLFVLFSTIEKYTAQLQSNSEVYEQKLGELRAEVESSAAVVDTSELEGEMKKWKDMYEELYRKVQPFEVR